MRCRSTTGSRPRPAATYPAWNFHKYVVDRTGKVVASFGSRTKPDDAALVALLEKLLAEPAPGP